MKKKLICVFMTAALLLCAVPIAAAEGELKNIALEQKVEATSSYIPAEGFFDASFLVDGSWETYDANNVKLGWNTNPYEAITETTPVDITVTLDGVYTVEQIVLKPMKWSSGDVFPRDFELQYSKDGKTYITLKTVKDANAHANSNTEVKPITYDISPTEMRYFRIHITKHSKVIDQSGSYTSAIGELELYGKEKIDETAEIYLNKPALNMNPNEKDWLKLYSGNKESQNGATYKSNNEKVVKVDADGTVTSISNGTATITVTDKKTNKEYKCSVTVGDFKASDKFQIVAFIPYFYGSEVTEKTFDNLKKGGITNVELNFALDSSAVEYENIIKALQLAYERGLDVTVSEKSFNGTGWQTSSDAKILEFVKRYSHLPGVAAYYVVDEPASSTAFARAISLIKSVMPSAVAHMNYCGAYKDNVTSLQNELKNKYGLSLDYVMYDAYVFTTANCNENTLYGQIRYNQEISRQLGVPGASYVQAMNWNNNHRPNADEVRYQVFAMLAGGVKQLSYFCWKTPAANAAETYGPAIIDINNEPTDLFEPVSKINAQVQALGPTLMKIDMETIYHTGANFGTEYNSLPLGFFIQPTDTEQKLAVSHMKEKETGRNYAMIVNRDYRNKATVTFTIDKDIKKLEYISTETGKPVELKAKNGVYTVELLAGEGVLLRTNEDYNFVLKEITDYRQLEKAIKSAGETDRSLYRNDNNMKAFEKALSEAKAVLQDTEAKQSKVDSARTKLVTAQNKLIPIARDGVNLALNKKVIAENSYEDGTYFSKNFITDGVNLPLAETTHAGWSVDPYSLIKRTDPVNVTVDLLDAYKLNSVVIKPCVYNDGGLMPSDFEIQLSSDGKTYKTVSSLSDVIGSDGDRVFAFSETAARYVRVHITKHNATPDQTGGYLSQFGEIEVYGRELDDSGDVTETTAETTPAATETETADTTPETADTTSETEISTDTSKETEIVTDTVSETEALTDKASETEADTEEKTDAAETVNSQTDAETEPVNNNKKSNAWIAIPIIAAAVIAVGATVFVIIKKKMK